MDMADLCSRCGADLPAEARYCPRCGAVTQVPVSAERKVVSVLFADLTESTRLAGSLDPERFREVQAAFFRAASECLAALRGRVEKFVGDAVMAVFGTPHAHDDDALRAVRAAWEIRARVERLSEDLDLAEPLRVRIGVDSGPAVVGAGPADQLLVSGAAVNLAARLQQSAGPGEILAGDTTRQLTEGSVAYDASRPIDAKGFDEPVTAWPVSSLTTRTTRRTIPIVGRRRELTLLGEMLGRARETSRLHLVTVMGEPGIGKSRLIDEFVESLPEDVRVLRGRVSRFEEDAPFAPLADMLRKEIGADRTATPEEERTLLHATLEEICRTEELDETAGRLEMALGVGDETSDRPYRVAMVRAGFLTFLERLAAAGPLVVTFDELELARPELLELIEQVASRGRRLAALVLCSGRDEMLEVRPAWGGGLADAIALRLEPLPPLEAIELAHAAASLDDDTAERVASHAGGNPFFIVETTGMLLHERAEAAGSVDILERPPLPATVQAVIAARIDHLDEESRDLVRKASVFSRPSFRTSELAFVADPSETALTCLEEEELLVRDTEQPDVWRFNHEVVRDVAYDSLPKRERVRLHVSIADRLQELGYLSSVASHLERAARASLDLDPLDRTIPERAADALLISGNIARRRMELRTAIDLYERALSFGDREERWGKRESHVMTGIGEACYWLGEFPRARDVLTRALRIAPEDPWTLCVAHRFLGDIALSIDADIDVAEEHFGKALPAARELAPGSVHYAVVRTLLVAGWAPYMRGRFEDSIATFTEALETARANPDGDPWGEARALTFVANTIASREPLSVYRPMLEEAMAIGRRINDPFTVAVAQEHYATALAAGGDLDAAIEVALASVAGFRELGAQWETASALADAGETLRVAGRPREAEPLQREALAICRQLGDRQLIGWVGAELALSLRAQGRTEEARAILDEVSGIVDLDAEPAALRTRAHFAYDAGDVEGLRVIIGKLMSLQDPAGRPNTNARQVWFASRFLGAGAAGGDDAVRAARDHLERSGLTLFLTDHALPGQPLR